jgi:putative membrane protein
MEYLKDILRGILIGVANVIPGVSGGTIALSLGVYEKILSAINNFRKDLKESVKTLLPFAIGAVVGIICLAFGIEWLLDKYPIPTITAFIGLVLGGLPSIYGRVKNEKIKWTHIVSFILFTLVIIVPTIISAQIVDVGHSIEFSFISVLLMFALGIVSAVSMVVPGVSGSMVLMMLGYYETIIKTINTCIKAVVKFDFSTIFGTFGVLVPFGIGVLLGILIASKVIEKLLQKYPNTTIWGIIALVATSPFAMLYGRDYSGVTLILAMVSIITFVAGFYMSYKLSKK